MTFRLTANDVAPRKRHASLPGGLKEATPEWHLEKFIEFTAYKGEIGEPSPHLAIVGHLGQGTGTAERLWLLGCYAATYCLPSAQIISTLCPNRHVLEHGRSVLKQWLEKHWKGIVTRTERRCVRSPNKMAECLWSYRNWMEDEFPKLAQLPQELSHENYDIVWESVSKIKFFGRYINIRLIEGLRRFHNVPAMLYDIRSIGGWSPKRCLCYLYPQHAEVLLTEGKDSDELADRLAHELLARVREKLPAVNEYVLAAMLCEYKGAFENYHQYPGWTIDQEPLLYDKVYDYWGDTVDKQALWNARKALFPPYVLGEISGWNGTRWPLTKTLRDYRYNWSDRRYDYIATLQAECWANPIPRGGTQQGARGV